ncbi:hypothetical protein [Blastococcus saxobsidens]|uniref:Uncharacterized protein n=1 Tax=Blastococcus saxobsidens TaxID=138336 RepID=A0A4Q7Y559_9ACTN|nr:hypothetical protein [Blastococcus saxobsidens]RZU30999.1 hypothetical protein BKA19_0636 [Blastococcus saxobsidens]
MTALSLERLLPTSPRGSRASSAGDRLARYMTQQSDAARSAFDAATAYEQAHTRAARRAVLNRLSARMGR